MDRYDRQLRLWGEDGQLRMHEAHICLVTVYYQDPLLQEVAKNLVLSGVRQFTIIAEHYSGGPDCFFNDAELFGATGLNSSAKPERTLLTWNFVKDCDFNKFSAVVIFNLAVFHSSIAALVDAAKVPILVTSSSGRLGYVHLRLRQPHFIIDTHRDHLIPDLRLYDPWPQLQDYLSSFDLSKLDDVELSQVPYPAILYQALQRYKEQHGDRPKSSQALRRQIDDDCRFKNCQYRNFLEAKRFAHLALRSVEDDLNPIERLLSTCSESSALDGGSFVDPLNEQCFQLLRCLRTFIESSHSIPLTGELPDMESSSESYGILTAFYKERRKAESSRFKKILETITDSSLIPDSLVEKFISSSNCLDCLLPSPTCSFRVETDHKIRTAFSREDSIISVIDDEHQELSFVTAAITGGLVSQEVAKIVTHQNLPIDNTLKYNALTNETLIYKI